MTDPLNKEELAIIRKADRFVLRAEQSGDLYEVDGVLECLWDAKPGARIPKGYEHDGWRFVAKVPIRVCMPKRHKLVWTMWYSDVATLKALARSVKSRRFSAESYDKWTPEMEEDAPTMRVLTLRMDCGPDEVNVAWQVIRRTNPTANLVAI